MDHGGEMRPTTPIYGTLKSLSAAPPVIPILRRHHNSNPVVLTSKFCLAMQEPPPEGQGLDDPRHLDDTPFPWLRYFFPKVVAGIIRYSLY